MHQISMGQKRNPLQIGWVHFLESLHAKFIISKVAFLFGHPLYKYFNVNTIGIDKFPCVLSLLSFINLIEALSHVHSFETV